jgi:hypothetical protein
VNFRIGEERFVGDDPTDLVLADNVFRCDDASFTLPLRTSPTSNATRPPGRTMRCSSRNTPAIARCHASTVRAIRIGTASASMPQNQHRSQLSSAYCTTSRNGGDVTTSCTLASANAGIAEAGPVASTASTGGLFHSGLTSRSSERDFFSSTSRTSRNGGACARLPLILRCASGDTAWFGGSV